MHIANLRSRLGKRPNLPADAYYDPYRRLLAAVVLQAVRDAHFPEQRTPQTDRARAHEFLVDDQGVRPVVEWLGLPWAKVQNGDVEVTFQP
jgi:hypothetical protein